MDIIFFDSWSSIFRTIIITILAYASMIFFLRTSGKRTLSKMNAFDFIITVALGSTLATVNLNKNVALIDGILGFFLLIYLQYLITYLSFRSKKFSDIVKSTPILLVYRGEMLMKAMKKERINEDEIHAIVRDRGMGSLKDADAIVLETDGTLTVIPKLEDLHSATMKKVNQDYINA